MSTSAFTSRPSTFSERITEIVEIPSFTTDVPQQELQEAIVAETSGYVKIQHPDSGDDNLIKVAYRGIAERRILTTLANNRFYLYKHSQGESSFVRADTIPKLWHRIRESEFSVNDDGMVYSVTPPKVESRTPKLLVIFSSIYVDIYSSSLMRYFMRNFPKAQTVLTPETAILRIADIGGVVGGFYLPTTADPAAATKVGKLIDQVAREGGVKRDNVVLYGASKGGTAAVYHGITSGRRFVAVDPIVSDEYYETMYRDSHFTGTGIFPSPKQRVFQQQVEQALNAGTSVMGRGRWAIIYSDRSPQHKYIQEILVEPLQGDALFLNSQHPEINDHPDVAPKTMAWAIAFLNMSLNDIPIPMGVRTTI